VDERKKYIQAIECLFAKPPISKKHFPIVTSRYEDFVALHTNSTGGGGFLSALGGSGIHNVGVFLPWHRYVVWVYEETIRNECGWDQAVPYWDWHLDTPEAGGGWLKSPVFDPVSGFGGNGAARNATSTSSFSDMIESLIGGTGGGCVMSGPFKDIKLHIGPLGAMNSNTSRCLTRSFDPSLGQRGTKVTFKNLMAAKTFGDLRTYIEMPFAGQGEAPFHTIGHGGVGGEVGGFAALMDHSNCKCRCETSSHPQMTHCSFFITQDWIDFGPCGKKRISKLDCMMFRPELQVSLE
jgi:tyrosinase